MSLSYLLKEGIGGFRRAKLASLGSVITISIALMLVSLFCLISLNASRLVEGIRQRVELEAFLAEPVAPGEIREIDSSLRKIEGIEEVRFISKTEAAKIFKEEFGEDIGELLDYNPLPASFKIYMKEGYRTKEKAAEIESQVRKVPGVENLAYRRDLLEFLDQRIGMLYKVGMVLGILLAVSAVFLVSNTIRLAILTKKKSVQTMKLVGASRWFVRAPFIIEGVLQGFLGGVISAGLIYYMINAGARLVSDELAGFLSAGPTFYILIVSGGLVLGLFGSLISVHRFIKDPV